MCLAATLLSGCPIGTGPRQSRPAAAVWADDGTQIAVATQAYYQIETWDPRQGKRWESHDLDFSIHVRNSDGSTDRALIVDHHGTFEAMYLMRDGGYLLVQWSDG